jgi:hypothetical protein
MSMPIFVRCHDADAEETCIRAARDTGEAVDHCCDACHLCSAARQITE